MWVMLVGERRCGPMSFFSCVKQWGERGEVPKGKDRELKWIPKMKTTRERWQ